jgi:tetratricopeptide (TPR) repeat protein
MNNNKSAEKAQKEGSEFLEKEKYNEAIACYTKAIELNPNFADAYYGRGNAFYCLEKYETALECFEQAVTLYPDFVDVYLNLGSAYLKKKNINKAIEFLRKAAQLGNKSALNWLEQHDLGLYPNAMF